MPSFVYLRVLGGKGFARANPQELCFRNAQIGGSARMHLVARFKKCALLDRKSSTLPFRILPKRASGRMLRPCSRRSRIREQENVVELILLRLICGNGAVRADKLIYRTLDVVEVARIGSAHTPSIHAHIGR